MSQAYYCCDASKLDSIHIHSGEIGNTFTSRDTENILLQLSLSEIHSVLFLLIDLYDNTSLLCRANCYIQWIKYPKQTLLNKIKELLNHRNNGYDFLLELLGTIQNFKLLKSLGVCKHQFFKRQRGEIKPFWKLLFYICKELDKEELVCLQKSFLLPCVTSCEELLCYLFVYEKIEENNLEYLANALDAVKRQDLGKTIIKFNEKGSIPKYYLPIATASHPCGRAYIINNEVFENSEGLLPAFDTRDGSSCDVEGLKLLWINYGLETTVYNNLPANQVLALCDRLARSELQHCFVLVVCLLSHGDKECIYGTDGVAVNTNTLVKRIAENPMLNGKPKVFIVQACQGKQEQEKNIRNQTSNVASVFTSTQKTTDGASNYFSLPNVSSEFSDVYVANSTIPNFVSYRNKSGSIFISEILKQCNQYGHIEDIDFIMRRVQGEVRKYGQTTIAHNTLNKKLVFNKID